MVSARATSVQWQQSEQCKVVHGISGHFQISGGQDQTRTIFVAMLRPFLFEARTRTAFAFKTSHIPQKHLVNADAPSPSPSMLLAQSSNYTELYPLPGQSSNTKGQRPLMSSQVKSSQVKSSQVKSMPFYSFGTEAEADSEFGAKKSRSSSRDRATCH